MKVIVPKNSTPSYMKYPIIFSDKDRLSRCIRDLTQAGFRVAYRYMPLHLSPFCRWTNKRSDFGESSYISDHLLPLDISLDMDLGEAEESASIVNSSLSVCD
jgi:dTDP-4-amino-4,6-dideoxygalactose transaminase